ncbi:hypothetical protein [Comamonas sediminis]
MTSSADDLNSPVILKTFKPNVRIFLPERRATMIDGDIVEKAKTPLFIK